MRREELERLRAVLRDADPAAGVEDPAPEVSARLRRCAMASLPERAARQCWLGTSRWVLATAAAALVAVGGASLLWVGTERPPTTVAQGSPPPRSAARGAASIDATGATASAATPTSAGVPAPARGEARHPLASRAASRAAAAAPGADERGLSAAAPPAEVTAAGGEPRRPSPGSFDAAGGASPTDAIAAVPAPIPAPPGRQIQLTAPGGTRIVWILIPEAGP